MHVADADIATFFVLRPFGNGSDGFNPFDGIDFCTQDEAFFHSIFNAQVLWRLAMLLKVGKHIGFINRSPHEFS